MVEITVDPTIFEAFPRWSGWVPAGYWVSWLGVLTPISYAIFKKFPASVHERRLEESTYPECDSEILDHVVLLEAVLDSSERFVMVDLGAGWGRWLANGAYAAKQKGLSYYLVGVEAEPQHFQWMGEHLDGNGIEPAKRQLAQAAVSSKTGDCWFYVGRSGRWYGQSAVPDSNVVYTGPRPIPPGTEIPHNQEVIRRVRALDLAEVLRGVPEVDFLTLDIQGAELEVLAAQAKLLHQRVKHVDIATHSHEVEEGLRKFFRRMGWTPRYDVPLKAERVVRLGRDEVREVQFKDGVQVWLNPRFPHKWQAPARLWTGWLPWLVGLGRRRSASA